MLLREPLLLLESPGGFEILSGSRHYLAIRGLIESGAVVYKDGQIGLAAVLYRNVPASVV